MEIEQSGPIIAHFWRNHSMRPIISRYFSPIKRVEMIKMHFGTQHSQWEPPKSKMADKNRISDKSHKLYSLFTIPRHMTYHYQVVFVFKIIYWHFVWNFNHFWIPRTFPKSKMAAKIWKLSKVAQLLLIVDETMACDPSFHIILFQLKEST